MNWLKRIDELSDFQRSDPLQGLKRDIADEIADHLACAQDRERGAGCEEDVATRKALENFGDPARLARRLWRDAVMDRMVRRWIPFSLAAMAVLCLVVLPPLQRARTEANVKKANGEMRSLATAIFDYNTALIHLGKEGIFPGVRPDTSEVAEDESGKAFRFGRIEEVWPNLTSPIQAITSIPRDPFDPEGGSYRGAVVGKRPVLFLIIGMGPDGDLDLRPEILEEPMVKEFTAGAPKENVAAHLGCPGCGTLVEALRVGAFAYSPTNGTYSNGDLVRFNQ